MNFTFLKRTNPISLYLCSVICFVLANLVKAKDDFWYGLLLIFGIGFFVFGLVKRMKTK